MSNHFKLFGVGFLLLILAVVYVNNYMGSQESQAHLLIKEQVNAKVEKLMNCYYEKNASVCFDRFFQKKGRGVAFYSDYQDKIDEMVESLGERVSSRPQNDSWSFSVEETPAGIYSTVVFKKIANYEKNSSVIEEFSLSKREDDTEYRIEYFNVNY